MIQSLSIEVIMKSDIALRICGFMKVMCNLSLSIASLFTLFRNNNLGVWNAYIVPSTSLLVWSFLTVFTTCLQLSKLSERLGDVYTEIETSFILKMTAPYLLVGWAWVMVGNGLDFKWKDFTDDYNVLAKLTLVWLSIETGLTFLIITLLTYLKLSYKPNLLTEIEIVTRNSANRNSSTSRFDDLEDPTDHTIR